MGRLLCGGCRWQAPGGSHHCQQAAEKILKGFHVRANIRFRRTNDLAALADVVAAHFPEAAALAARTETWTGWNSVYRYPGEGDVPADPTIEELEEAAGVIEHLILALLARAPDRA